MGGQTSEAEDWPLWVKAALLVTLLVAIFLGEFHRLGSLIYSDADEGTYVYAGKLLAENRAIYRDFLFAHPPLVPIMIAALWKLSPGLMPARLLVLFLNLFGGLALFFVAQALFRSYLAALLTLAASICSMLLVANMGRTARLEPVLVTVLLLGTAFFVTRPGKFLWNFLAGAIFAAALLVKLVAVVPILFLFIADVAWPVSGNRQTVLLRWSIIGCGGALILLPATAALLSTDNFWEWAIQAQALRPREPFMWRLDALGQSFVRCPLLPVGLVAALWVIFCHSASPILRAMAIVALGTTTLIAFAFKSYATYYVVLVLPWTTLCLVALVLHLLSSFGLRFRTLFLGGATLILGCVVPVSFSEFYHRRAFDHVEGPSRLLALLPASGGPLYSMAPDFNLWAGRNLPDWYFAVDSYLARVIGRLGDVDFDRMLSCVDAAVLFRGEFDKYPQAHSRLKAEFQRAYLDATWELWIRDHNSSQECETKIPANSDNTPRPKGSG